MKKTPLLLGLAFVLLAIIQLTSAYAQSVSVTPSSPVTGDDLTCDVSGSGSYIYRWYEDGSIVKTETVTSSDIASSDTEKGEVWRCVAYKKSSYGSGTKKIGEDSVTIQNSCPEFSSSSSSHSGSEGTSLTITHSAASDAAARLKLFSIEKVSHAFLSKGEGGAIGKSSFSAAKF